MISAIEICRNLLSNYQTQLQRINNSNRNISPKDSLPLPLLQQPQQPQPHPQIQSHIYENPKTKHITIFQEKSGKLHGSYVKYTADKRVISDRIYENDDLITMHEYFDDGSPRLFLTLNPDTNIYREITYYPISKIIRSIYEFHRFTGKYASYPIEFSQAGIPEIIYIGQELKGF